MNTSLLLLLYTFILDARGTKALSCSSGLHQKCQFTSTSNSTLHCECVPLTADWTPWGSWSPCSASCGEGNHTRHRSCIGPHGAACHGNSTDVQPCTEMKVCPGNWNNWGAYSSCTVTCGGGFQIRSRNCSAVNGSFCIGNSIESSTCNTQNCPVPVSGSWSAWTSFGACSVTCGTGIKTKTRTCSNPVPSDGGSTCPGHDQQAEICREKQCAVDGNWSGWGSYSHCDVTCGTGWKLRRRNCTNPPPSGGGGDCVGLDEEGILCLNKPCPIDGAWSAWSRYSTCSMSCGGGNRERNRTCNNPEPSNGGRDCTGNSTMSETCNTSICPGWGSWGAYTPCSKPCGAGRKYRFRTCQGQNATFCDGLHYQYASCNLEACSESFG